MPSHGLRNTALYVSSDAGIVVERDARLEVDAGGFVEVFRDARLEVDAGATVFRDAWLEVDASATVFRDARLLVAARTYDDPVLRFSWQVLQPADVPQAFTWKVLEVSVVGGELRFRWRVLEGDPGQGFSWTVIPAELLELFASQGVGAAAGIAPDTLLPVGRATKD